MSDASKPQQRIPQVPRGRLSTQLEAIRDADDAAGQDAQSELVYRRLGQDYARPGNASRLRVRWRRRAMACIVGADAVAGLIAALAAALGRGSLSDLELAGIVLGSAVSWSLVLTIAGVYENRTAGHGSDEFRRIVTATVSLLALLSTSVLASEPAWGAGWLRRLVLIAVPVAGVLSLCAHLAARIGLRWMRRRGRCLSRVVAVGMERSVAELVRATRRDSAAGLSVVGVCLTKVRRKPGRDGSPHQEVDGIPVMGAPADAVSAVRQLGASLVLITAWSDVSQEDLRRLSWELEGSGVELLVAPKLSGVAVPRLHIRTVDGSPLVHVDEQEFTGLRRIAKAGLDYGLSTLITLMISPVLIAVALAVKLTSPGPVMFRQERVGRFGEKFTMHKFRSMYVDAEQRRAGLAQDDGIDRGPLFKMRDDPRVTPVGRFIRRYSLDELPQLLDVVLGRMSLVGPRPPLEAEVATYEHDVRRRLRVKPGMTGLWQVSGRSNLSWEDAVRLDLQYVENWSLTADLSIMFRTVTAVLARDGAY